MFDLIIRGGTVYDGNGGAPVTADIGIRDGKIAQIGRIAEDGRSRVIDADGAIVTPGFVDIHTHFDGQVLWDERLDPSFSNGVTTAIFGNCGIGFAPMRKGSQDLLIDLMDGVEEIPGAVLAEGLDWNWTSFSDYLNRIEERRHSLNVGCHVTHGPLRYYVMGEKILSQASASDNEIAEMVSLLDQAFRDGAWGLSSSRTEIHMMRSGRMTPDYEVEFKELRALAEVAGRYEGVFAFAPAGLVGERHDRLTRDMAYYERMALETRVRIHLLMQQNPAVPDFWREQLAGMDRVAAAGGHMMGQAHGHGLGILLGLLNTNPFQSRKTWLRVMELPAPQRLAEFRNPQVRAAILSEPDDFPPNQQIYTTLFGMAYSFTKGDDFEPPPEQKLTAIAAREGRSLEEVAYDLMLENGFVYAPALNYGGGNLEVAKSIFESPHCVLAASDAGAHCRTICDGALPTFMLTHWARDRTRGERLTIERVVEMLTRRPARSIGLTDRGVLAQGRAADINVIDFAKLGLKAPHLVSDLPSGADRLLQSSKGYRATIVNGRVTREHDAETGERPGKLLRKSLH